MGFQSHAGSIEADLPIPLIPIPALFQSHAGSIEARIKHSHRALVTKVSIPRWFD